MRNVKDVQAVLDNRFGGAGRGVWSVLRILVWTGVGLVLIGLLAPAPFPTLSSNKYNAKIPDRSHARVVTLDKNDPRGFRRTKDGKAFTIAWVGPSTLQNIGKRYSFIPADVRDRIPELDGRPVVVDIYFMSGARVLDLYSATQAAIASDADMIVLDLNPLWLFNDRAVQAWETLNGTTFADVVDQPSQWGLAATFYSPSDVALGLAGRKLAAIRDRWSYSAEIRDRIRVFNRLDTSTPPPAKARPSELDQVALMQEPLEFWSKYRPTVSAKASVRDRQLAFLEQSDVSGGTLSDRVVDKLLGSLADAGRPAFVYVPPLAPDAMADPKISAVLAGIETHLGEAAARHRSPLLEVRNQSLGRVLPPGKFNDLVHIAEDGPIVTLLAGSLCDQLVRTRTVSTCTPLPEGAPR